MVVCTVGSERNLNECPYVFLAGAFYLAVCLASTLKPGTLG